MKRLLIILILLFPVKLWAITDGTFLIDGTGAGVSEYATVALFEAAIEATMYGNLTGELDDREHAVSTSVVFDTDTNTFLLKITAFSGDEHDGTFPVGDGDKAWINFVVGDNIKFDETTGNTLDNAEISNLALDGSGNNSNVVLGDGGVGGLLTVNRMLIKGDGDTSNGILIQDNAIVVQVTNNIVYGIGDTGTQGGIRFENRSTSSFLIYNNTCIRNYNNFYSMGAAPAGSQTIKNNIALEDQGGSDYGDAGGAYGTSGTNISTDATSPDGGVYDNYGAISGVSDIFVASGTSDWKLDSTADATVLALIDTGEDLSGTFTDDIDGGVARDDWDIGAHELAAAAPGGVNPNQTQSIIMGWLKTFALGHPVLAGGIVLVTKLFERRMRLMK